MLVSGIKSRPTYPGIEPELHAKSNVIVCDSAGAGAVIKMMQKADAAFAQRSTVLLLDEVGEAAAIDSLVAQIKPAATTVDHSIPSITNRLADLLRAAKMGVCVYAAGSEPLISSVVQTGMRHGINHRSIRTEHAGSLKRRVQCVHCKGMNENVTVNPVQCAHCGLHLLVRDHFSRRFAAFQGVCIDAEVPGEIPEAKAEFK